MRRYEAAIIGCGRIGFGFDSDPKRKYIATHAGAYKYMKDVELAAVCDINKQRIKGCMERWNISKGYTDFVEMLEKEQIDILSICTLPNTHYPILKKAVKFPLKAIFCEKPLADDFGEAREMVKLCERNKILLQVDHQRRFDPLHIRLMNLVKNKELGEVQQVNFYYTAGIKNTGSHMFDLLRFFFGDVDWAEAFYSKNGSTRENDPNLDGILRFKNGVFAAFEACDVGNYLIFELNCLLEKGRFALKNSGFGLDFYKSAESRFFSGYKELYRARPPFNIRYKRNFMVNSVRHLIECVRKNKESISSGNDGLAALELIEAAIYSAKNNGKRIFLNQ